MSWFVRLLEPIIRAILFIYIGSNKASSKVKDATIDTLSKQRDLVIRTVDDADKLWERIKKRTKGRNTRSDRSD